jgi:hypothetical protein
MEMTITHKSVNMAAPFWVAFGAPLLGVPIMVVLFALAPSQGVDAAVEPEIGFAIEQALAQDVDPVVGTGLETSN